MPDYLCIYTFEDFKNSALKSVQELRAFPRDVLVNDEGHLRGDILDYLVKKIHDMDYGYKLQINRHNDLLKAIKSLPI